MTEKIHNRVGVRDWRAGGASGGFALVVTVSLLVLLAVIAVGLLTLSTVTMRSASEGTALAEARANARLGMMMALGELQKQLGPDQRITAEAGLNHEYAAVRSHWVGAYRSWLDTVDKRPDPEFLGWLVSGDRDALAQDSAADGDMVAEEMVRLVGPGTMGKNTSEFEHVEAGKVNVGEHQRYAWWVSDENTKVRAPRPAAIPTSLAEARTELVSAPQAGIERLASFEKITRDNERLHRAITLPSLGLVASNPAGNGTEGGLTAGTHFHEVTTDSLSLVTNVRKGGFRKDLSMELETSPRKRPTKPL
ncbi:MAG: hypothetical protein KAI66_26425 [Lentisphaeria bacterium]|nr:hypothetical protein [Lentisphaeria bacterium]